MTVYIDVLIVLNVYISYFTVRAAGRILHTNPELRRLVFASVFGGVSSLAALLDEGIVLSLLIRCSLTAVMTFIAFGFGSAGKLALRSFVCLAVGMLLCGAAMLVHELTGSTLVFSANGYVYMSVSALVLVIASAAIYGLLSVFRRILDGPGGDRRVKLTVSSGGKTSELEAVTDSGNYLRDFLTGRHVVVCKLAAVESILPPNVSAYLDGSTEDLSGIRLIPMETASGSGLAAAFRPERVTADTGDCTKTLDVLIAVSRGMLENESFDALISPKLLQ